MGIKDFLLLNDYPDRRPSIGRRFVGFLIDFLILLLIFLTFTRDFPSEMMLVMILFLTLYLYAPLLMMLTGATLGQRLLGMRVIDPLIGGRPTFVQGLIKSLWAFFWWDFPIVLLTEEARKNPIWDKRAHVSTILR